MESLFDVSTVPCTSVVDTLREHLNIELNEEIRKSTYVRIVAKQGAQYLFNSVEVDEPGTYVQQLTVGSESDNEEVVIDFEASEFGRTRLCQEGFLQGLYTAADTGKTYMVLKQDHYPLDADSDVSCIELNDVREVHVYSEEAALLVELLEYAGNEGTTADHPRVAGTSLDGLSPHQIQPVIEAFWPEPKLVYSSQSTVN